MPHDNDEPVESILDVQKRLPDLSDDALDQIHDDIMENVTRFVEHVGPVPAASFIASLIIEMEDRGLPTSDALPRPKEKPAEYKTPERENNVINFNRARRRALASKAKGSRKKR